MERITGCKASTTIVCFTKKRNYEYEEGDLAEYAAVLCTQLPTSHMLQNTLSALTVGAHSVAYEQILCTYFLFVLYIHVHSPPKQTCAKQFATYPF